MKGGGFESLVLVFLSCSCAHAAETGTCAADSAECSAASKVHHVIGTIQTIDCQLVDCKDAKGFISRGILPKLNADSDEQNWQPVVLTNTHVQNWEALGGKNSKKKWTLQRLAESTDADPFPVKAGLSKEKYFSDDPDSHDMCRENKVSQSCTLDEESLMTFAEFKEHADAAKSVYAHVRIKDLPKTLVAELSPLQFIDVTHAQTTLWLGANGTIAHTHYDMGPNFHVMLDGTKRFHLSPPSSHSSLFLYPYNHAKRRRSQVQYAKVDAQKFEDFGRVPTYIVDLQPGQVLYIPSFWFHRVESLSPTVSLNEFLNLDTEDDYSLTRDANWGFNPNHRKSVYQREPAVYEFFGLLKEVTKAEEDMDDDRDEKDLAPIDISLRLALLNRTMHAMQAKIRGSFDVRDIWRQRYRPLWGDKPGKTKKWAEGCAAARSDAASVAAGDIDDPLEPELVQKFETAWVTAFEVVPIRGVREILFWDWVEYMTQEVLGVKRVSPFLQRCV